jgi:hypothetical protein
MTETPRHINDILADIQNGLSAHKNTLGLIMDAMHERGFGILIILFSLPMAMPLPVPPGINLLFSLPLLFLTFQQIYGAKHPYLPTTIKNKKINHEKLSAIIEKCKPWMARLSILIKPRLGFMTHGLLSHLIGVFGFIFALCICIPIPLTNTVPSFAIMIMAVGVLMRDGLAIIAGMVIGVVWIGLLATLGVAGFKAVLSTFM